MAQVQDLIIYVALAASLAMGELAVHLQGMGSPQSAAVPRSFVKSAVAISRPEGWEEFEKVASLMEKTERGTFSAAQVRQAIKSLSERLGKKVDQNPVGIESWITQNLLPQATQTKAEMQHEVDAAMAKVDDCASLLWSLEKEVEHREKILLEDESSKYQCIAREHQLHKIEVDRCNDKITFQQNLQPPASINSVSKTPMAMKQALTLNYEFYNSVYPEFMNKKAACDDATNAAQAQLAECDADEAVIEEFYCKMKKGRDDSCANYASCYDQEKVEAEAKVAKVQALEAHVKEQFQNMSCFGHVFSESSEANPECDPNAYTTNHLDVVYPSTPRRQACASLMNTRRDYGEIVCNEGVVVTGNASRSHCTAGFAPDGNDGCAACTAGEANPTGWGSCVACAAGKYTGSEGASECVDCPAGKYSEGGMPMCSDCNPGETSTPGSASCTQGNSTLQVGNGNGTL